MDTLNRDEDVSQLMKLLKGKLNRPIWIWTTNRNTRSKQSKAPDERVPNQVTKVYWPGTLFLSINDRLSVFWFRSTKISKSTKRKSKSHLYKRAINCNSGQLTLTRRLETKISRRSTVASYFTEHPLVNLISSKEAEQRESLGSGQGAL